MTIIVHGSSASTYGRTCQITLREKGAAFEVRENAVHTPEQEAVHPWGKVPAVTFGDVHLFETIAITHYADTALDGPELRPSSAEGQARVLQWMSAIADNLTKSAFPIIIERLIVPGNGGEPNEAAIEAQKGPFSRDIDVFEEALERNEFLAGSELSLADLLLLPIIDYMAMTPEGEGKFEKTPCLNSWRSKLMARPAVAAVLAPELEPAD